MGHVSIVSLDGKPYAIVKPIAVILLTVVGVSLSPCQLLIVFLYLLVSLSKMQHVRSCHLPSYLITFASIAFLCAGVTAYKAIKESEVRSGQFICIIGAAGGLGHLVVQYARVMGCRVIALDVGQEKMDYLQSLGAEYVIDINNSEKNPVDLVKEYSGGGAHAVINLATHSSAYDLAIKCARRKGFVVLVAMPKGDISVDVVYLVLNRITIRGSIVGTREDMREALDFASRGLVKCEIQVRPLEEVNEVIEEMLQNKTKGRVVFRI